MTVFLLGINSQFNEIMKIEYGMYSENLHVNFILEIHLELAGK